jgi:hypothetical protein
MGAALVFLDRLLSRGVFATEAGEFAKLALLVGVGGAVYFGLAFLIGGVDREALASLRRRPRAPPSEPEPR